MRLDGRHSTDGAQRLRWRAQCLRGAGFTADLAERLAREEGIDLHQLLELVDRGCPPELAARILAPLEEGNHITNQTGGQTR
jgi:hypothetical protein